RGARRDAGALLRRQTRRRARASGARIDPHDPLAVLHHGKSGRAESTAAAELTDSGPGLVSAPMQGTIVSVEAREGDSVRAGQPLLVMEAMKMEHVIAAPVDGIVRRIGVAAGDTIFEG